MVSWYGKLQRARRRRDAAQKALIAAKKRYKKANALAKKMAREVRKRA